jgi:hypothetical protein
VVAVALWDAEYRCVSGVVAHSNNVGDRFANVSVKDTLPAVTTACPRTWLAPARSCNVTVVPFARRGSVQVTRVATP